MATKRAVLIVCAYFCCVMVVEAESMRKSRTAAIAHLPNLAKAGANIDHYKQEDDEPRAATREGLEAYRCYIFLQGLHCVGNQLTVARRDGVDEWFTQHSQDELKELLGVARDCRQLAGALKFDSEFGSWDELELFFSGQTRAVPCFDYFGFTAQATKLIANLNAIYASLNATPTEKAYKTIGLAADSPDVTFNPANTPAATISQSGVYRFLSNLTYARTGANSDAIRITSDNVVLDLAGFTLMLSDTAGVYPNNGVSIVASKQITIKDGTIVSDATGTPTHSSGTIGINLDGTSQEVTIENLICGKHETCVQMQQGAASYRGYNVMRNCSIVDADNYGVDCQVWAVIFDRGVVAVDNTDLASEGALQIPGTGQVLARDSLFELAAVGAGIVRIHSASGLSSLALSCAVLDNANTGLFSGGGAAPANRLVAANCYGRGNVSNGDYYIGGNNTLEVAASQAPSNTTSGTFWRSIGTTSP